MISSVLTALVAGLVSPVLLRLLSRASRPPRSQGEFQLLEYGWAYQAMMLACCAFFLVLSNLAHHFPGRTDPTALKLAISVFLFFAVFGAGVFVLMGRATVYWNDQELRGPNSYGRISQMTWGEIASVEYVGWAQGFRLRSQQGGVIWAYPVMQGFEAFFRKLQAECAPRDLMPEVAPLS